MNEKLVNYKWRNEKLRCLLWGFVPVFDFFAYLIMADNSGQEKYRKKGLAYGAITLLAFGLIVTGDLLMYFTSYQGWRRGSAYIRSIVIVAIITIPLAYLFELVELLIIRKTYLSECALYEEFSEEASDEDTESDFVMQIDLNTCSQEELMTLPGIDAATSIKISSDRSKLGGYSSVEDFIDLYKFKPHFTAAILERAYVSETDSVMKSSPEAEGTRPSRVIDI